MLAWSEHFQPQRRDGVGRPLHACPNEARHWDHAAEEEMIGVFLRPHCPVVVEPLSEGERSEHALIGPRIVAVEADLLALEPSLARNDDGNAAGSELDPGLGSVDDRGVRGSREPVRADVRAWADERDSPRQFGIG